MDKAQAGATPLTESSTFPEQYSKTKRFSTLEQRPGNAPIHLKHCNNYF